MGIWKRIGDAVDIGAAAVSTFFDRAGGLIGGIADPATRRQVAFSVAMIALSAKMAKADGVVTEEEVQAFQQTFRTTPQEEANVRRVFNLARQDTAGYEVYAKQIARIFAGRPAVLEDILDGLFEIAKADGVLHPGELEFLKTVAEIFGFAPNEFRRIRATHFRDAADPYVILGISYEANEDEIRRTYRMLVRENHPDSMIGRGVPDQFVRLATEKLAAINEAYAQVLDERGLSR